MSVRINVRYYSNKIFNTLFTRRGANLIRKIANKIINLGKAYLGMAPTMNVGSSIYLGNKDIETRLAFSSYPLETKLVVTDYLIDVYKAPDKMANFCNILSNKTVAELFTDLATIKASMIIEKMFPEKAEDVLLIMSQGKPKTKTAAKQILRLLLMRTNDLTKVHEYFQSDQKSREMRTILGII